MSQHCDGSRAWVTVDEHGADDTDQVFAFLYICISSKGALRHHRLVNLRQNGSMGRRLVLSRRGGCCVNQTGWSIISPAPSIMQTVLCPVCLEVGERLLY